MVIRRLLGKWCVLKQSRLRTAVLRKWTQSSGHMERGSEASPHTRKATFTVKALIYAVRKSCPGGRIRSPRARKKQMAESGLKPSRQTPHPSLPTTKLYAPLVKMCIHISICIKYLMNPSQFLSSKESAFSARHVGLIPGSGRFPGVGNGNLLQNSCLGNPVGGGAWWSPVHEVTGESDMN